jgi:cell wall assembly regulator SMI1
MAKNAATEVINTMGSSSYTELFTRLCKGTTMSTIQRIESKLSFRHRFSEPVNPVASS